MIFISVPDVAFILKALLKDAHVVLDLTCLGHSVAVP